MWRHEWCRLLFGGVRRLRQWKQLIVRYLDVLARLNGFRHRLEGLLVCDAGRREQLVFEELDVAQELLLHGGESLLLVDKLLSNLGLQVAHNNLIIQFS